MKQLTANMSCLANIQCLQIYHMLAMQNKSNTDCKFWSKDQTCMHSMSMSKDNICSTTLIWASTSMLQHMNSWPDTETCMFVMHAHHIFDNTSFTHLLQQHETTIWQACARRLAIRQLQLLQFTSVAFNCNAWIASWQVRLHICRFIF